jgi:hypothetical protein
MQALVDKVEVRSSEAGTSVVLAHSLAPGRVTATSATGLHATR